MRKNIFILLGLAVFIAGCATVNYLPSASKTFAPTTAVKVLWERPQKPYIELGQINVESADFSEETLFKKLKEKAMKIGADAVIITSTKPHTTTGGGWFLIVSETVHRIEALAIKWQETEMREDKRE